MRRVGLRTERRCSRCAGRCRRRLPSGFPSAAPVRRIWAMGGLKCARCAPVMHPKPICLTAGRGCSRSSNSSARSSATAARRQDHSRGCSMDSPASPPAAPHPSNCWRGRAHGRIENRNHWRRDATLGEDRLQLSCKSAALVMATLTCRRLALFDHLLIANTRKAMRIYNAHPEQALALLYHPL